jgi:WD40 repeat protein
LFDIAFGPDGATVATASADNTARISRIDDPAQGDPITLEGHREWVFDVAFSPDGQRVVTASGDGTARIWSLSGVEERSLRVYPHAGPPRAGDDPRVLRAVFSPDGSKIATASAQTARVWNLDGSPERWVIRHTGEVNEVAFRPADGRWLLTASSDSTVRLSDSSTGHEILTLRNSAPLRTAAFDPRGRYVLTGDIEGHVRLWRIAVSDLAAYLNTVTTACLSQSERTTFLGESSAQARARAEECERRNRRTPAP